MSESVVTLVFGAVVSAGLALIAKVLATRKDDADITDTITQAAQRAIEMLRESQRQTEAELTATRSELAAARADLRAALTRIAELEAEVAALNERINRAPNVRTRKDDHQ